MWLACSCTARLFHVALELVPALGSLLVMVFSARVTIPTLSTSTSVRNLLPAGLLLALGMMAGHFLLARIAHFAEVNSGHCAERCHGGWRGLLHRHSAPRGR
jgi:hypothetical protein